MLKTNGKKQTNCLNSYTKMHAKIQNRAPIELTMLQTPPIKKALQLQSRQLSLPDIQFNTNHKDCRPSKALTTKNKDQVMLRSTPNLIPKPFNKKK